ncbi:MAG: phosphatase PAP2 family protein [Verrucomicrobiota bacterium]|nr:phosphatase PAP2 family protein [Verrucomicrobiota bacterium]
MCAVETQTGFSRVKGLDGWRASVLWALLAIAALVLAFVFDGDVQRWATLHQAPALRAAMRNVSRWGDWPAHVVAGLVAAAIAWLRGSRTWLAIFIAMVLACAAAGLVNRVIKVAAGRARPAVAVDAGWNGPRLSSKYNAFPSGHTAASTAFFTVLLLARRRIGLPLLAIPLLIAFSRLYIGAHYLSDVVAGAVVGASTAALIWCAVRSRLAQRES